MSKNAAFVVSSLAIVLVLTLSYFNLRSYFTPAKILGAQTEVKNNPRQTFWEEFLTKNPTYFPGWIELSKIDKADGNLLKSVQDLNRARSINPNSPEVN
ncbi:MAG: hypothetical protein ABSA43_00465 [Candidatus Microgenomates bacterium]|jgi:cytochrome c-type biogenesis protein CcmH/NrfG